MRSVNSPRGGGPGGSSPPRIQHLVALAAAVCLFLASIEYVIPKPLPFLRIGLANLPLLLALDLFPISHFFRRPNMKPENRIHLRILQDALFDHEPGTTRFAARGALFGWLEDEFHITFEILFH